MGKPKVSEVGGGKATGLGNDLATWLDQALRTGTFGSGAGGGSAAGNFANNGISAIFNDILSPGAGKLGGALGETIQNQKQFDLSSILGRFGAGGGMSFGSPAAYGASNYLAKEAPAEALGIGNLQMSALAPILNMMMGIGQKGISQRQTMVQPSDLSQALSVIAPVAGAAFGAGGAFAPAMAGGASGGMSPTLLGQGNTNPAWGPYSNYY